jgi:hypothetical protein
MHLRLSLFAAALLSLVASPAARSEITTVAGLRPEHPRLLATADDWSRLAQRRAEEPDLAAYHEALVAAARHDLDLPPVTYLKTGKRLLAVSREALRRVLLFAYAYRATGEEPFARRAESEMLAVAAFADWNPSHFLDVGEMTAALALGYDWVHDGLTPAARATIRRAIVDLGLKPGLEVIATGKGWPKVENNWNQVCFGGLTLGALAVADEEPAAAATILAAAKADIHHGLAPYAPDGVYPEGPSYWAYGTSFQVLLNAALESALGTDWDLAASPGFLASAGAYLQTTGPTGRHFNFSDGSERAGFEPAVFWFARKLADPGLLLFERRELATPKLVAAAIHGNRLAPLAALWWPRAGTAAAAPSLPLRWSGQGLNPIAVARGSWTDSQSFYLALKGGAAELNHAHMDAGSFVYEANGVRWAIDLGMQEYESLESKGIDLWNKAQSSQRWTVFRLNNASHNTLTLGGQPHRVDGHARLRGFSGDSPAVVDLSPVFAGQAKQVHRSFRLLPGGGVAVGDSLAGLRAGTEVRWQIGTRAEISLDGRTATLRQDGRSLIATLRAPTGAVWQVRSADPAPNSYDAPNPGVRFLTFLVPAPADGALELQVELTPASAQP